MLKPPFKPNTWESNFDQEYTSISISDENFHSPNCSLDNSFEEFTTSGVNTTITDSNDNT